MAETLQSVSFGQKWLIGQVACQSNFLWNEQRLELGNCISYVTTLDSSLVTFCLHHVYTCECNAMQKKTIYNMTNSKPMLCSISDVLQQMDKWICNGRFVSSVDSLKLLRRDYSRIWCRHTVRDATLEAKPGRKVLKQRFSLCASLSVKKETVWLYV